MSGIAIVGSGVAGLHLGLYLVGRGVTCTLYTNASPDDARGARFPGVALLLGAARGRDRELGTNHWDDAGVACHSIDMRIRGMPELSLCGRLRPSGISIDMRLYVPKLVEDFAARGGRVVASGPLDPQAVKKLGTMFDLVVVEGGGVSLNSMFPRIIERSSWLEPQRRLFSGLFRGVRAPEEPRASLQIVPGHGEIFENQILTAEGSRSAISIEAIPGGGLDPLAHLRPDDDPRAFETRVLDALEAYAPHIFARVEQPLFRLMGPLDWVQTAVVPTARRGYVSLGGDTFALAVGDAFATHDPLLGQGVNAASRSAWALGEMIASKISKREPFDQAFCDAADQKLWSIVSPSMEWTNVFLSPPPPRAMALLAAAARSPAIADAFVSNFDDPSRQCRILTSSEGVQAFLSGFPNVKSPARRAVLKAS